MVKIARNIDRDYYVISINDRIIYEGHNLDEYSIRDLLKEFKISVDIIELKEGEN